MRLIDADKLLKDLDTDILKILAMYYEEDYDPYYGGVLSAIKEVKKNIENKSTAYDVDAVVKQLEDEEAQSYNDFANYAEDHGLTEDDDWHCMGLKRAIEIVKGGGSNGQGHT